jgi:hypothetical protein
MRLLMVRDIITHVTKRLDEVLHERKKFICLNDNMNNPSEMLVETLRDFYEKYYPNRSPFELPEGERNPSLYLDELKEIWSRDQRNVFGMAIVAFSIIGLVIFFLWRSGKLKQIPLSPSSRHRRVIKTKLENVVKVSLLERLFIQFNYIM